MTPVRPFIRQPCLDAGLLDRLMVCSTVDGIASVVKDAARRLGFEYWIYAVLMPVTVTRTEEFVINAYPEDWSQHYLASGYAANDPSISYARAHVAPSLWSDFARYHSPGTDLEQMKAIFQDAASFGLTKGMSVPLHGLGCLFGVMSYASRDPRHPIVESTLQAEAALLAMCVHQAVALLINRGGGETPSLTPRERECLKWAAEGESAWEIAHVLNISERTAVFHLMNAAEKLGVVNRQQAVAKALILGLLEE